MMVKFRVETTILLIAAFLVLLLISVAILVLFCVSKKHFYIQRAGLNPFKNIYRVLKYSMLGSTRFPSVTVPSPTGKRIFHLILTLVRTSMEDHSPRHSYAFYHSSCMDTN